MAITSVGRDESNIIIDEAQAFRLGGYAPFAFPAPGLDPSFPLFSPRTINLNYCDKSTYLKSCDLGLAEEFAGAALDDAIRADHLILYPLCGVRVAVRGCEDGHLYGISAICGREWCKSCGGHRGRAHNRRIGQFLAMLQEWGSVAYGVLTIPPELRPAFRDLRNLSLAGSRLRRWLRGRGIARGVSRWHLFGEAVGCEESILPSTPAFAPHVNVLCEAGYLQPEVLAALRRAWRVILERIAGQVMDDRGYADRTDGLVIDWQYVRTGDASGVRQAVHWLTYVFGPRFFDAYWDRDLAVSVVGWRNSVRWGKMSGVEAWALGDLEGDEEMGKRSGIMAEGGRKVLSGECPECGGRLYGMGIVPVEKLRILEDYGGGVYRLASVRDAGLRQGQTRSSLASGR